MEIVTVTKAKARFSEIIARLIHRREAVVITRKKRPVAALVPYEDWARTAASRPDGLAAAAGVLARFDDDIDELLGAVYAARLEAEDREVPV